MHGEKGEKVSNTVIQEWTDEKGWVHRLEIPLTTFLIEHDLEPVVRCKDCKKWETINCPFARDFVKWDGFKFCAWGEKREDDQERTDT